MPLLPVSTAQSTNVLFWVCPCNKMRANPLHSTHIHTRIRFWFSSFWYHMISFAVVYEASSSPSKVCLITIKRNSRSSTAYNQTEKMLKLLPTSSMLLSSKQNCLGCYVCKKNNVWYEVTRYLDIYKYNQWMNHYWRLQYYATFYARAIICYLLSNSCHEKWLNIKNCGPNMNKHLFYYAVISWISNRNRCLIEFKKRKRKFSCIYIYRFFCQDIENITRNHHVL